ncbi:MAG: hypothetical protein VX642_09625 [Bdellovibrionota bacterium]|nr:hypothetical protein [Bdellovibrionota bacterium]
MKQWTEIIFILLFSFAISYLPVSAFEIIDFQSQSIKIQLHKNYQGLMKANEIQVYEIDVEYKSAFQIALLQKRSDIDFEVVDAEGNSLGFCDEHGIGKDERCIYELHEGKYFIVLEEMWEEFSPFQLKVEDVHEYAYY